jgi:hypothetical protein
MRSTVRWGTNISGNGELIAKPPSTRDRQSCVGMSWLGKASGCVSARCTGQGQLLLLSTLFSGHPQPRCLCRVLPASDSQGISHPTLLLCLSTSSGVIRLLLCQTSVSRRPQLNPQMPQAKASTGPSEAQVGRGSPPPHPTHSSTHLSRPRTPCQPHSPCAGRGPG